MEFNLVFKVLIHFLATRCRFNVIRHLHDSLFVAFCDQEDHDGRRANIWGEKINRASARRARDYHGDSFMQVLN